MTGETPATAIAGMACSAALRLFGFHARWVARSAVEQLGWRFIELPVQDTAGPRGASHRPRRPKFQ